MSGPAFVTRPDPALPLYFMDPAPEPGLPEGYQVGYWVTSPAPWPDVPLSLGDSWTGATGVYLFLNATPADLPAFAASLVELLHDLAFAGARFLWVTDPDAPLQGWLVQALSASQPAGVIDPMGDFAFRNYRLLIGTGSVVSLTEAGDGFSIEPAAGDPTAISLDVVGLSNHPLTGGGDNLPFTGPGLGCLTFGLASDSAEFFASIDSGIRYFTKDPAQPSRKRVKSLHYPVFAGPPGQVLAATFDPANQRSIHRTFLGFPASGEPVDSWFTTNFGTPLALTPTDSPFAPCGPRLVLASKPTQQDVDPQTQYYFAPAGSFAVGAPAGEAGGTGTAGGDGDGGFVPPATRVQCGAAGVEYLGLSASSGSLLHFFPDQPAFAPAIGAPAGDGVGATADDPRLTDFAVTSWLYATPPDGGTVEYFAQPDGASLYGATGSSYLQFLEVPGGTLRTGDLAADETPAFPMVPYQGVAAASVTDYAELEGKVLSPLRRDRLRRLAPDSPAPPAAEPGPPVTGATPQGLLVTVDAARTAWQTLTLANRTEGSVTQALRFHDVRGGFRQALQTNQLFTVLRDAATVLSDAGLEYEVTDDVLRDLASKADPVPPDVLALLVPLEGTTYLTDAEFQVALQAALGSSYAEYGGEVTRYAAVFDLEIESWRFRLSPTMWDVHPLAKTICVVKYAARPLEALAADVTAWSWPEAAGDLLVTQQALLAILADAAASVDASRGVPNDLDYFVRTVMREPAWNGILFLNVNVPLSALPPDLSGLVSGIDPEKFFGHHLGIELTPVEPGATLTLGDSSLFGLILYEDPEDLYFNGSLYDFKVLLLKVLFANSTITGFASRIELMTNAWFGDRGDLLDSDHSNNLILDGSRQLQGDAAAYVYVQEGSNVFVMRSAVLREVEVTRTQFVTVVPAEGSETSVATSARFLMWGKLRFDPLANLDLFSFGPALAEDGAVVADGYLPFANLAIDMVSDGTADGTKVFTFDPKDVAFDAAAAVPRPESLYAHLPLVLSGLVQGTPGTKPADLGYVPVKTPLTAAPLTGEWFGLVFQLDLGTLGALAGPLGFTVSLMAAWSPNPDATTVQVGVLLPGGRSLSSVVPVQGVISLGFSSIDLTASQAGQGIAYMLRFNRLALRLLGFAFPPGQTDLYLFGNPDNTARSALGWYAAYLRTGT